MLDKFELGIQTSQFSFIGISEVRCLHVKSWSAAHDVSDHLHGLLLLERIRDVLICLHVGHHEKHFLVLELCLQTQDVIYDLESIFEGIWLFSVRILQSLLLVEIE